MMIVMPDIRDDTLPLAKTVGDSITDPKRLIKSYLFLATQR
jgi:hypothetical protein